MKRLTAAFFSLLPYAWHIQDFMYSPAPKGLSIASKGENNSMKR
ncbi:hypothetical protein [Xylanibacillus composti]|nr:hypothetical protein [Xylanibacillus composti]